MAQYREYQAPIVGQARCTYSNLRNIYMGQQADGVVPSQSEYIVPKLCPNGAGPNYPPRYDTLSHGQNYLCGGYFSLKGAYPYATCTSCQSDYVKRPCSGNIYGVCSNKNGGNKEGYCYK